MYEISSEVIFSAAHRLLNYEGPCENIHGHNWRVRACVCCAVLNDSGIAVDFRRLRELLGEIVAPLDHKDLTVFFESQHLSPSSENLARYIFGELRNRLERAECTVHRVEVYETPTNFAAYFENA